MPIPSERVDNALPVPPQDVPPLAIHPEASIEPVAGLLAVLLPGLGHFSLGEPKRAVLLAVGILGLFFGGMLIGGIDVIDSREDTIWFVGQAMVGPLAFGVDYYHQNHLKIAETTKLSSGKVVPVRSAKPGEGRGPNGKSVPGTPPSSKSLGRMNELGTLFATIAGMLNPNAIIDAFFPARRESDPAILSAQRTLAGTRR
jgi:hypothetical protein